MTIKLITTKNSAIDYSHWDFVNPTLNQYKDYFVEIDDTDCRHVLNLTYFGYNKFEQLSKIINIDQLFGLLWDSEYKCPFNGYDHSSILPVAILTSPEQAREYIKIKNEGREPYYTDMACDPEWVDRPDYISDAYEYLNDINRASLGPGFTYSCCPSDGHTSYDTIGINMENGDTLLCIIIKWYNK